MGTLKTHLSRANTQWQDFDPAQEALIVFQGPETYITPSWYAAKREHGKVVPTWNYAIVQAYGRIRIMDDPDWLRQQIAAMTETQENLRPEPWSVERRARAFRRRPAQGHRRHRDRDRADRGQVEGEPEPFRGRPLGVSAGLRLAEDDASQRMADMVDARGALPDG